MPTMQVNGAILYYIEMGQGVPIIFVHPPVLTSVSFSAQLRELSQQYRTIAFDIRGHGKSPSSNEPLSYPLIASDMKELMNGLGIDRAFLCGYSTGGSIVLEFLLHYPERAFGGIVVSGLSEVHDLRLKALMLLGATMAKFRAMRTLSLGLAWSNAEPGTFRETFKDAQSGSGENAEQYYRYGLTYNCTDQLSEIKQPVLLVFGSKDKGFRSYAELLHQRLPQNQLVYIQNVKHQIPTKAVVPFHQVMTEFMNKTQTQVNS